MLPNMSQRVWVLVTGGVTYVLYSFLNNRMFLQQVFLHKPIASKIPNTFSSRVLCVPHRCRSESNWGCISLSFDEALYKDVCGRSVILTVILTGMESVRARNTGQWVARGLLQLIIAGESQYYLTIGAASA